ncbi:MAG: RNA methyltransferase [Peptostreptococcaceae bacterium]|nr:RNA methyltransferase [Peptostreptococcaceae bacterium]
MIVINSNENKNFKLCSQLAQKKFRDKLGLYLIEGPNLLEEAVNSDADIKLVVFNEKMLPGVKKIWETGIYKGAEVFGMSEKLFEKLAQTEASQGVLGVIKKNSKTQVEVENGILSNAGNVIILDRLQDPGNIGTIIRTAEAAGYRGVVVLKGTADIYSPKVIRAAAGSVFRMPVLFFESPAQAMELLKKYGKKVVTTCFDTENNYYDIDLKKDIGLVIGNEGNGICRELIEGSDIRIKIPMTGIVESLNAAVAAGIVMFEAIRK